jgi:hypothetical protein
MKKRISLALIASSMVVPGLLDRAVAQPVPALTTTQISGPALAVSGEHLLFCMDGHHIMPSEATTATLQIVSSISTTATLQIVNSITGGVVAQKILSLVSGAALPPDPCVEFVVPAPIVTFSSASTTAVGLTASRSLYTGVISLNPQPLPRGLLTSLQVFTPGFGGIPFNVRYVPPSVTCPPGEEPCVY